MIPIRPLPAAGLLVLLLGLSGCGYNYSLEERIAALRASGYNVEPREPNKRHAQQRRKRAKPRTASEDHTLHTGSIDSVSSRIETWKPVPADQRFRHNSGVCWRVPSERRCVVGRGAGNPFFDDATKVGSVFRNNLGVCRVPLHLVRSRYTPLGTASEGNSKTIENPRLPQSLGFPLWW